ncbi:MAG TPA: ATP-binding cassette domain-containing protein [Planctomycetota bacterium]|nr:ATP-binding cassette domain-containing protein [Planctomycetota bacterium]
MKLWPITALGPPGEIITWTEGLGFGHGVRTLRGTMSAFAVQWDAVSKVYANGVGGLDTLALDAPAGEILAIVGRSGSGKTTALKLVNRLLEPTSGRVLVDGRDVREGAVETLRRGLGTVLARPGLLPHLTAIENIALLPRVVGWDRARRLRRARELLSLVGLEPSRFGDRSPDELSTGEQQRVALARALALDPPILLLDEPTSALDPVTRARFQEELARLQDEVRKTLVLVTHDMEEARRLADRVAVLEAGRLLQVGTIDELRDRPAHALVSSFFAERPAA